jgi:hypothetical protein
MLQQIVCSLPKILVDYIVSLIWGEWGLPPIENDAVIQHSKAEKLALTDDKDVPAMTRAQTTITRQAMAGERER